MNNPEQSKEALLEEIRALKLENESLRSYTEQQAASQLLFQEELRATNDEYRLLIEMSPVAMAVIHDWKTIFFNPAALQLFGATTEREIVGKPILDFVHPECHRMVMNNADQLAQKGYVDLQEQLFIRLDGNILEVETQAKSIRFNNDQATLVVMNDITNRKRTAAELAYNQERFRIAQDMSPDGFTILRPVRNADGVLVDFLWVYENEAVARMNGTKPEEVVGRRLLDLFPGHKGTPIFDTYLRVASTGETSVFEAEYEGETINSPKSFRLVVVPMDRDIAILAMDITERVQAERALKESEENLSITLNSIGDGFISTDRNGFIVRMNPVAERLCGWSLAEAFGKPVVEVFDIVNAFSRQQVVNPIEVVIEKGEIVDLSNHTILISRTGAEYHIADSAAPIKNKEDEIIGVVLVFSDVTEKYLVQQQLAESEERYKALHNASFGGIAIHDKGIILECNQGLTEMSGYSIPELIGMDGLQLIAPLSRDLVFGHIVSGYEKPYEALGIRKNGEIYPMRLEARNVPYKGRTVRTVEFRDLTETKHMESELQKIEWLLKPKERVEEMYEPEYGDVTRLNTDGVILKALGKANLTNIVNDFMSLLETSSSVYELNGDYAMELLSSGWCKFMDQSSFNLCATTNVSEAACSGKWLCHESCWNKASVKAIETGMPADVECNGGIHLYAVPIFCDQVIIGAINFGYGNPPQDIEKIKELAQLYKVDADKLMELSMEYKTRPQYIIDLAKTRLKSAAELIGLIVERKLTEQELLVAKEKAEESDRLKSAFLANMSHEIRTPMNGILGFADLLKEPGLSGEKQQEYVKIIQKSGTRMLNIINDIIDISKIEAGLMKVSLKETNINDQIEYLYNFFRPEVEAKSMVLSFRTALPAQEAQITTDPEKLYAILTNLVKNAIKYSIKGSIELGYRIQYTGDSPQLEFFVKDTGIGIPKSRQEAIFERFIQADIADTMARQGAGLGLSIARAYVNLLGGSIGVESEEGVGSEFYFTLPYTSTKAHIQTGPGELSWSTVAPERKLKILIVEDDEISAQLIELAVNAIARDIIKVRNGSDAIIACKSHPDIDIVLMDIQLPVMSGYEASRAIREFNTEVVIIAQTAFGLSGDREKALEAGCTDYIAKPVKKAELLKMIESYVKK